MDIVQQLRNVKQEIEEDISSVSDLQELERIKVKYTGRKGVFRKFSDFLKTVSPSDKPEVGKNINSVKGFFDAIWAEKKILLTKTKVESELENDRIDVSLPGASGFQGGGHILKDVLEEIVEMFVRRGFFVREGPNIETEDNNFSLLNFTKDHPARLMHDTFYLDKTYLLRTHTSNVQVREMPGCRFPLKVVAPGLCFRNEDVSARSHLSFHQIEVFYIDRFVGLCDLTDLLESFFKEFFRDSEIKLRFRHSYFPFVEPGIEVDVTCIKCKADGCSLCKGSGWLEVAGAGLVHPNVLRNGGIDPEKYSGYALGMGVERLVMLRHEISDIRLFLENDLKFLSLFS